MISCILFQSRCSEHPESNQPRCKKIGLGFFWLFCFSIWETWKRKLGLKAASLRFVILLPVFITCIICYFMYLYRCKQRYWVFIIFFAWTSLHVAEQFIWMTVSKKDPTGYPKRKISLSRLCTSIEHCEPQMCSKHLFAHFKVSIL